MRVKASVGLRRISNRTAPTAAIATMNMNAQFKQIRKNLEKVLGNIDNMLPVALEDAMRPIFDESQRLVPKDTLRLMHSGFLETGTFRGKPTVNIGYAKGNSPDYAVYVHENLYNEHKSPTQAKFLEEPMKRQMHLIAGRVAASMRKRMK